MDQINADVSNTFTKIDSWLDGFFRLLPNIATALVFVLIAWGVAALVQRVVRNSANRRGRESLGNVVGSLTFWTILIAGFMVGITIIVPSVTPGDLFAGLGIGSVAIGFAFKDILQNMLAGLLILLRQPFEVGDQIVSGSHEGTVEKIETRATFIKTYDGKRVVIPNSDIYTNAVEVNTAFDLVRTQYDVGIGYADDFETAAQAMVEATARVEGVVSDPAPEALPWALDASWKTVRLRWWTDSKRTNVVHVKARVIGAIAKALTDKGIDMPYDTQVLLFHDQTEASDGDRAKQREGWPSGSKNPQPARLVDRMKNQTETNSYVDAAQ